MSERRRVANDPDTDMVFRFAGESPHAFAYKVWIRRPADGEWTTCECCEGDSEDDVADECSLGMLPDGTLLDIPVAVGGARESAYRGRVVFTQDGQPVDGGELAFSGRTSDDGAGAEYLRVVLS